MGWCQQVTSDYLVQCWQNQQCPTRKTVMTVTITIPSHHHHHHHHHHIHFRLRCCPCPILWVVFRGMPQGFTDDVPTQFKGYMPSATNHYPNLCHTQGKSLPSSEYRRTHWWRFNISSGVIRYQAITWANVDLDQQCNRESLGNNELTLQVGPEISHTSS